jgi:hypothetical protein
MPASSHWRCVKHRRTHFALRRVGLFMLGRDMFIVIRPSHQIIPQIHNLAAEFAVFGAIAKVAHIIQCSLTQSHQLGGLKGGQKIRRIFQSKGIFLHIDSPRSCAEKSSSLWGLMLQK